MRHVITNPLIEDEDIEPSDVDDNDDAPSGGVAAPFAAALSAAAVARRAGAPTRIARMSAANICGHDGDS